MKSLVAANRTIVSQLVGSLDPAPAQQADSQGLTTQADGMPRIRLLRHTSMRALRNTSVVVLAIAGVAAGTVSVFAGIGVIVLSALVVWMQLARRERRRINAVERDLPALVTSVASSVRAGVDPLRAICDAEEYFPPESPFVPEVRRVKQRLAAGDDEFAVVADFLVEDANPDVELFKQCILLSRRHGSSLAEPLHRVVRTIRQRQSFKRKTRAALAMHRMSAVGIAGCAIVITGMQLVMNITGVKTAFENPAGKIFIGIGASLIVVGVVWMLQMGKEEKL
jgi:Flp pilus assembly protein TadB